MKTVSLLLNLTFADKIYSDEDIAEIAAKVANAIVHAADIGCGIAPEDSDTYLTEVEISHSGIILKKESI
jgi:hypothetical protein